MIECISISNLRPLGTKMLNISKKRLILILDEPQIIRTIIRLYFIISS